MKKAFSFSITLTIALLSVLSYSSCVTTKKKGADEPGGFKKRYHNLTSHYNYWFNADELFRLTLDKMNKSHKDNYNQLLPVYAFRAEDPLSTKPDMENVIKKSSTSIGLHRISGWTDDCYLLIGKSQYVKQDLETAEATFNFIKEEHNPNKKKRSLAFKKKSQKEKTKEKEAKKKEKELTKKKKVKEKKKRLKEIAEAKEKAKKEREKNKKKGIKNAPKTDANPSSAPDEVKPTEPQKEEDKPKVLKLNNPYKKSIFQRTSAYPESMIWFVRTYTAREKYNDAEYLIEELWNDRFLPKKLRGELAAAEADNFIQQKRYKEAIAPLQKAVQLTKKKKTKARLSYILAQLYEKAGMHQEAYASMNAVLKNRPTFEMEFNAKLQKVKSGWQNGTITATDAQSALKKMGKEDKNKEYKDQIYYTLGLVAMKEKDKTAAIDYFKESLSYNVGNDAQKAETYLALADLYFETEQFVNAKNYYDSTLTALAVTDPRHKQVSNYAKNLDNIARLITTIRTNDSIIALYNMSPDEKLAFAKKLKKQQEQAEAEALAASAAKDVNTAGKPGGATTPIAGLKKSSFYFYNDNFVKKGRTDFNRIWGGRPLEDNWRRSQKSSIGIANATDPDKTGGADGSTDAQGLEDILRGIPSSPEDMAILHLSTYKSMYELGAEFRDKLENNNQCIKVLEESIKRYPDSTGYQKESWYYLYVANKDISNMPEAKRYYDLLVKNYPNSTYARTISDPNYLNASKAKAKELNDYYQETYNLFTAGKYEEASAKCKDSGRIFGSSNVLKEKFALLNAISIGKTAGKDGYCTALKEVIGFYPESAEAVRAKEICRVVGCPGYEDATTKSTTTSATETAEAFTVEDDKAHYFMIVLHGADIKINDVKISISDYNRLYHATENLRNSHIYLGTDTNTPIFVLRKFDNKAKAMKYYNEVLNKPELLGENNKIKYTKEFYPVTQENYRRILKNRSMEGYDAFFKANYQ